MGKIETGNIHALLNQLLYHFVRIRGGAQRTDNLCLSHSKTSLLFEIIESM
jgi:hypothetical protein